VTVQSALGNGAKFTVLLPVRVTAPHESGVIAPSDAAA
jgi:hypothetical protein